VELHHYQETSLKVLEKGAKWQKLTRDLENLHEDIFIICNQMKVDEMGEACSTKKIDVRTIFDRKTFRVRGYPEDLNIDNRIVLE
jgi:hypothetical protein